MVARPGLAKLPVACKGRGLDRAAYSRDRGEE